MIGKSILHYEIRSSVGAGGMGEVYRAHDTKLGRDVALKLLPMSVRGDKKVLARFEREAKALAALNHPNIVTIYSIEKEHESPFLTMELVEGETLDSFICEGGMRFEDFQKIARPLTSAVAAAHASGVVHRDLKPGNIIVTRGGNVKVLDFGLALVVSEQRLTEASATVGTIAYMSPEQISGAEIDARSDIFSLGIVFHELLSGSLPFRGSHPAAIMYSIVNEDAPRLAGVPAVLADIVRRCLQKDPDDRFPDADSLRAACENLSSATKPTETDNTEAVSAEAQSAFSSGDWTATYESLHAAAKKRDLSAEELALLGQSCFWLGKADESVESYQKSYTAYAKEGRNALAAGMALRIGYAFFVQCAFKVSGGWFKKAERLLAKEPESIQHGHLRRWQTVSAKNAGDFDLALKLNRECYDIAERYGNSDLRAVAVHDHGMILVQRGEVAEGTALIDEAMTSAVSGEVNQFTLGQLYCRTMSVCDSLADYQRAREWSEAAMRWCGPDSTSAWPGICRAHSATNQRHRGQWETAEETAKSAIRDLLANKDVGAAGGALSELGMLALARGDYDDAESAFRQAHELGCDPVPGLPLLRLAQGKKKAAFAMMERALAECTKNRLQRAKLLAARVAIALANDEISLAEESADELLRIARDFDCEAFKGHALQALGAVDLKRGTARDATAPLREAWSIFNELGLPYDAARTRVLLGTAYHQTGNEEDAKLQLEAAQKTFTDLGARPDLDLTAILIEQLK